MSNSSGAWKQCFNKTMEKLILPKSLNYIMENKTTMKKYKKISKALKENKNINYYLRCPNCEEVFEDDINMLVTIECPHCSCGYYLLRIGKEDLYKYTQEKETR